MGNCVRKRIILNVFALLSIVALATVGCSNTSVEKMPVIPALMPVPELTDPLPTNGTEAPDDIVITPGGNAYRANVHEQGVPDQWPPVNTVEIKMSNRWDTIYVRYRTNIETKRGEFRNNLINIRKENGSFLSDFASIRLSTSGPSEIKYLQATASCLPGTIATVLNIEIPQGIKPGLYYINVGVEIDGLPYGSLPLTLELTE